MSKPERRFVIVVILTAICGLLPLHWRRWVDDVSAIVNVPVLPFRELGKRLGVWLRPPPALVTDLGGDVQDRLIHFAEEAKQFETLYLQERKRVQELAEQLQLLQRTQELTGQSGVRVMIANLAGGSARQPTALLTLNRGSRGGVHVGAVAVWVGTHLVGRVVQVQSLSSQLMPLTNPSNDLMRVQVFSRGSAGTDPLQSTAAQLQNLNDGTFGAEVDAASSVAIGDEVRVDEPSWPSTAQMLVVGQVDQILPMDDQPLRRRLIVRPRYLAHELSKVALKVEDMPLPEIPGGSSGGNQP